jgi:hypothetical protein
MPVTVKNTNYGETSPARRHPRHTAPAPAAPQPADVPVVAKPALIPTATKAAAPPPPAPAPAPSPAAPEAVKSSPDDFDPPVADPTGQTASPSDPHPEEDDEPEEGWVDDKAKP